MALILADTGSGEILADTGSDDGLSLDGTKSLPEPMLT